MIAFGPVPSRRLGRSLGINNIPPKRCTYACVYCQLGRTIQMQVQRQPFYQPEQIVQAVQDKVERASRAGERIDFLTFVPDGEPTLDVQLGRSIELLRPLGIQVAVISNASLIWRQDVREDLMRADWVSLKVDAVQEAIWRRIDRPHGALRLAAILDGMREFAQAYQGQLATETMLVAGINDAPGHVRELASYVAELQPATAYLAIPTRPPAESWVRAPAEEAINRAFQLYSQRIGPVEYLIGYEGNAFAFTGNVQDDLLSIMAVHPMREDAIREFLRRAGADWAAMDELLARHQLLVTDYEGERFYMRRLHPDRDHHGPAA